MKRILFVVLSAALAGPALGAGTVPEPVERQGGEGYNPVPPAKGYTYPECYCTDSQGRHVEIGDTACLKIGSKTFLARCGMSLNSPAWRRMHQDCPSV